MPGLAGGYPQQALAKRPEVADHVRSAIWCTYQKSCASHTTESRWLLPIAPEGTDWGDLAEALQNGGLEPPVLNTPAQR